MPFRGIIPAAKVSAHPFGLFSAAKVVNHTGSDDHWIGGASVETEACAFDAKVIDICGEMEPISVFDAGDAQRYFNVTPFGIVATDTCGTPGWSVQDRKARVVRQLELVTQKAVELELWNGAYTQEIDGATTGMYLSASDTEKVSGDVAVKPIVGLALLEQALATCGVGMTGVIHASPLVASVLGNQHLDIADGHLVTTNGNPVAAGAGYDGRGPGETDAPTGAEQFEHWMYATGPVFVHLGSKELITVTEGQATNAVTNEMTYVAERPALAYWDGCCHFAVKVDVRL
jgi:hypothetical protein